MYSDCLVKLLFLMTNTEILFETFPCMQVLIMVVVNVCFLHMLRKCWLENKLYKLKTTKIMAVY